MRIAIFIGLIALGGCTSGSAEGTVSGTITIDGVPVDGGLIRFIPTDGNSQPDDSKIVNGKYQVTMPPGEKRVEIFWNKGDGTVEDTRSQGTAKFTQMIPAKYNVESTLRFTFEKGSQTKDYALSSK